MHCTGISAQVRVQGASARPFQVLSLPVSSFGAAGNLQGFRSSEDMIFKRDLCIKQVALQGKCCGDSLKLFFSATRQSLYVQVLKQITFTVSKNYIMVCL